MAGDGDSSRMEEIQAEDVEDLWESASEEQHSPSAEAAESVQPPRAAGTEETLSPPHSAEMEQLRSKITRAGVTDSETWRLAFGNAGKLGAREMQIAFRGGLQLPPSVLSDEEIRRLWMGLDAEGMGTVSVSALTTFLGKDVAASLEAAAPSSGHADGMKPPSQGGWSSSANPNTTTQSTDVPSRHASMTMTMTQTSTMTMTVERGRWTAANIERSGEALKDHASWATHTQINLTSVRQLRQEAESQLMRNTLSAQLTQSTFAMVRRRDPVQDEVMRGVAAAEHHGRLLVERIDTLERLIRQVALCMTHLHRSRNSKLPFLGVAEKRLQLRHQRPSQELVQDHFQDALEREYRTLVEVRQSLAEHIDAGKELLEKLESCKDELLVGMQRKRHALRFDRAHLMGPDEALGDDRKSKLPQSTTIVQSARTACSAEQPSHELHTQQWATQIEELLNRSMPLETEAARFCSEADTAAASADRKAERAIGKTTASMKKRITEIFELKKQLDKEIRETNGTISQVENSLHNLQKQLDKSAREGTSSEALQEQHRWTKGVLAQLSNAREQLISDLQSKNLAWKIDESCSKITPIKELELDREPDSVASLRRKHAELQLPILAKRRAPALKGELLEKIRAKLKAAAYTGTCGRQLDVIFGRFDKDASGQLSDEEVRSALRRTLRIPPSSMTDSEIFSLCATLDTDHSGQVSVVELLAFMGVEPEVSKRTGRNLAGLPSARRPPPPPPVLEPEVLEKLRAKLKAAAYTGHAGRQLDVIFGRFDKDGSGQLEADEVRRALRRTMRIAPSVVSDAEITKLCNTLDSDKSGSVSVSELVDFIGAEPEVSKRTGKSLASISIEIKAPRKNKLEPDVIEKLRSKIKAAAYTGHSGRQLDVLFARFDDDGSGNLEMEEVRKALRRTLHITQAMISDAEISALCKMLDTDRSGSVSIRELVDFIGPESEISKRTGKKISQERTEPRVVARAPPRLEPQTLEKVRSKVKAAAYMGTGGKSGRNMKALFTEFDKDGSGQLEPEEVKRALRRTLKIPPSDISDDLIAQLCSTLDGDSSGSVSIQELIDFIGPEPTVSKRTGKALAPSAQEPSSQVESDDELYEDDFS